VDLSGWVGLGLGGNCDCRCGIFYARMLGGGVVGLTFSPCPPYSSQLFFSAGFGLPPGFFYVCVCLDLAHLLFCGRENKCVKCRNG